MSKNQDDKLDLMPEAAAKPKGKTVWVIGLFLLVGYYFIGADQAVQFPYETVIIEPQEKAQINQQSIGLSRTVGIEIAGSFPLKDYVHYLENGGTSIQDKAPSVVFDYSATPILKFSIKDGQVILVSKTYDMATMPAYGIHISMLNIIKNTLDIKVGSKAKLPTDAIIFEKYLTAITLQPASEKWVDLMDHLLAVAPQNTTLHWQYAKALSNKGDKNKARQHYMKAVSLEPKLSKHLPDWVLSLK